MTSTDKINNLKPLGETALYYNQTVKQAKRIKELETAISNLFYQIEKSMPDGYVDPQKEPEFITAYNNLKQLLKEK